MRVALNIFMRKPSQLLEVRIYESKPNWTACVLLRLRAPPCAPVRTTC